jgi:iron complex outermembrane receptor protein
MTPGVAILRDGLLDAEAVGSSVTGDFYDLQSVSVLKGPQGTFIGASAIGGAVEITSRSPTLGGPVSGYIDLQFGNYSDVKTTGAVNLPVSDAFAARLAFNYETQGSFARNVGGLVLANTPYPNAGSTQDTGSDPGHIDNKNVRLSMLWKPTDNFQALFKFEDNEMQSGGQDAQINPATYVNPITLAVTHAPFYANTLHDGPWVYDQYLPNQSVYQQLQINNLELRYTLPDEIELRSLSGYQNTAVKAYTAFVPPADIYTGYAITGAHPDPYYSQEFDVISPSTWRVNFIAGGSWFYRGTSLDNGSLACACRNHSDASMRSRYIIQQVIRNRGEQI